MNCIIIEDEYPAVERLQSLLGQVAPDLEILNRMESISETLEWLGKHPHPDLIFSDIQLSDGLSFEIFETIQINCPIIFTTAYDEYAIKAFKVKSIDYLLKPIKSSELAASLDKYKAMRSDFSPQQAQLKMESLLELLQAKETPSYKKRFLVKGYEQLIPVPVAEIAYFYTTQDIVYLVKQDGRKHALDFKMDQLQERLDPARFFRLNRQYLCQDTAIQQIHPYFNGRLKLVLSPKTEEEIIVSREKAKRFKVWMGE